MVVRKIKRRRRRGPLRLPRKGREEEAPYNSPNGAVILPSLGGVGGGLLFVFIFLAFFSCKTLKLSDADEKQRLGEYANAAEIYRKLYTKSKPEQKELRSYIAFHMGECNRLINNTPRALSAYVNAFRYNYPDSMLLLRLGRCITKMAIIRKQSNIMANF